LAQKFHKLAQDFDCESLSTASSWANFQPCNFYPRAVASLCAVVSCHSQN
jgi:hypothetical protein